MHRLQPAWTLALIAVLAVALWLRPTQDSNANWAAALARIDRRLSELDPETLVRTARACETALLQVEALRLGLEADAKRLDVGAAPSVTHTEIAAAEAAEPEPTPEADQAFERATELVAEAERLGSWDDQQASALRLHMLRLTSEQQASVLEQLLPLINSGEIQLMTSGAP